MSRVRPVLVWSGAAAAFLLYPVLRPYADETGLPGLAAMASDRWLVAHLLGMAAFVLLAVGVRGLVPVAAGTGRVARTVPVLAEAAVVLLLPYYGGEAFALHAVGRHAVATGDVGMVQVVDGFRYAPLALTVFGGGLVLLAVVGVLLALVLWRHGRLVRTAGLLVGLGLALYLPQFYGTPPLRIAHGVLLAGGCVAMAVVAGRRTGPAAASGAVGRTPALTR